MQACATGVRALLAGAQEIESGLSQVALTLTCDRTSNGPHLYYPNPRGPGGTGAHEDWVMDNFSCDPLGPHAMIRTAENVAAKHSIGTPEQHDVVLRREAQYKEALGEFHKRFMSRGDQARRRRGHPLLHRRGPGAAQAGARGRHGDLRRANASGRRQRGDPAGGAAARARAQPRSRSCACACSASARRAPRWRRCPKRRSRRRSARSSRQGSTSARCRRSRRTTRSR